MPSSGGFRPRLTVEPIPMIDDNLKWSVPATITTTHPLVVLALGEPPSEALLPLLTNAQIELIVLITHAPPTLPELNSSTPGPALRILRVQDPLLANDAGTLRLISLFDRARKAAELYGLNSRRHTQLAERYPGGDFDIPEPLSFFETDDDPRLRSRSPSTLSWQFFPFQGHSSAVSLSIRSQPLPDDKKMFDAVINFIPHKLSEKAILKRTILITTLSAQYLAAPPGSSTSSDTESISQTKPKTGRFSLLRPPRRSPTVLASSPSLGVYESKPSLNREPELPAMPRHIQMVHVLPGRRDAHDVEEGGPGSWFNPKRARSLSSSTNSPTLCGIPKPKLVQSIEQFLLSFAYPLGSTPSSPPTLHRANSYAGHNRMPQSRSTSNLMSSSHSYLTRMAIPSNNTNAKPIPYILPMDVWVSPLPVSAPVDLSSLRPSSFHYKKKGDNAGKTERGHGMTVGEIILLGGLDDEDVNRNSGRAWVGDEGDLVVVGAGVDEEMQTAQDKERYEKELSVQRKLEQVEMERAEKEKAEMNMEIERELVRVRQRLEREKAKTQGEKESELQFQRPQQEQEERERVEAERLEREAEKERAERVLQRERERVERDREQKRAEVAERERMEKEKAERDLQRAREQLQRIQEREAQRLREKLQREQEEKEQLEKERLEKERLERERLEKERLERERLEKEQLEKERLEKERLEKERLERERLEKERLEKERLEEERLEKERLRRERLERERLERERQERERLERERLEKERLERERLEKERLERELEAQRALDRQEMEKVERDLQRAQEQFREAWRQKERLMALEQERERKLGSTTPRLLSPSQEYSPSRSEFDAYAEVQSLSGLPTPPQSFSSEGADDNLTLDSDSAGERGRSRNVVRDWAGEREVVLSSSPSPIGERQNTNNEIDSALTVKIKANKQLPALPTRGQPKNKEGDRPEKVVDSRTAQGLSYPYYVPLSPTPPVRPLRHPRHRSHTTQPSSLKKGFSDPGHAGLRHSSSYTDGDRHGGYRGADGRVHAVASLLPTSLPPRSSSTSGIGHTSPRMVQVQVPRVQFQTSPLSRKEMTLSVASEDSLIPPVWSAKEEEEPMVAKKGLGSVLKRVASTSLLKGSLRRVMSKESRASGSVDRKEEEAKGKGKAKEEKVEDPGSAHSYTPEPSNQGHKDAQRPPSPSASSSSASCYSCASGDRSASKPMDVSFSMCSSATAFALSRAASCSESLIPLGNGHEQQADAQVQTPHIERKGQERGQERRVWWSQSDVYLPLSPSVDYQEVPHARRLAAPTPALARSRSYSDLQGRVSAPAPTRSRSYSQGRRQTNGQSKPTPVPITTQQIQQSYKDKMRSAVPNVSQGREGRLLLTRTPAQIRNRRLMPIQMPLPLARPEDENDDEGERSPAPFAVSKATNSPAGTPSSQEKEKGRKRERRKAAVLSLCLEESDSDVESIPSATPVGMQLAESVASGPYLLSPYDYGRGPAHPQAQVQVQEYRQMRASEGDVEEDLELEKKKVLKEVERVFGIEMVASLRQSEGVYAYGAP